MKKRRDFGVIVVMYLYRKIVERVMLEKAKRNVVNVPSVSDNVTFGCAIGSGGVHVVIAYLTIVVIGSCLHLAESVAVGYLMVVIVIWRVMVGATVFELAICVVMEEMNLGESMSGGQAQMKREFVVVATFGDVIVKMEPLIECVSEEMKLASPILELYFPNQQF